MIPNMSGITVSPWVVVIIAIAVIAFLVVAIIWGIKAHRLKISAGKEDMIGKSARVVTEINPKGLVFLEGEQWNAISESGKLNPDEEVIVTRIDGLKVYVKKNN